MTLQAIVIVVAVVVLVGALAYAFRELDAKGNALVRVMRLQVSVSARVMDAAFWVLRHAWHAAKRDDPGQSLKACFGSLAVASLTLTVPAGTLVMSEASDLAKQGVALGAGGLIWSVVVELTDCGTRTRRIAGHWVFPFGPMASFALVVTVDLVVIVVALIPAFPHGWANAATFGAMFVALADLMSMFWSVVIAALNQRPLVDA